VLTDNLPSSLREFYCKSPELEIKYPNLFNYTYDFTTATYTSDHITYINTINEQTRKTRITERTKQINANNILLELYMKRMMHPERIRNVVGENDDDDDADVGAIMDAYVATL
jgi:hypothetical protein